MATIQDASRLKIRAAERAFALVEVLASATEPVGLIDLSQRMGLAPATVHRMLVTLVSIGWAEQRSARSGYQLSERMLGVAALALANNPLVRHGRSVLERLTARSQYNSYLCVLENERIVYLATARGDLSPRYDFYVGTSARSWVHSAGKVILAYLEPEERDRVIASYGARQKRTPATVIDAEELERQFSQIRQDGYFIDRGEYTQLRCSIAAPVRGAGGRVHAAIVCAGSIEQLDGKAMLAIRDELLPLAAELSELVGGAQD